MKISKVAATMVWSKIHLFLCLLGVYKNGWNFNCSIIVALFDFFFNHTLRTCLHARKCVNEINLQNLYILILEPLAGSFKSLSFIEPTLPGHGYASVTMSALRCINLASKMAVWYMNSSFLLQPLMYSHAHYYFLHIYLLEETSCKHERYFYIRLCWWWEQSRLYFM